MRPSVRQARHVPTHSTFRVSIALSCALLSCALVVGCGKKAAPERPTPTKTASAASPDPAPTTPVKAAPVAKKFDPVPTGPAPGEKVPAPLPVLDPAFPMALKGTLAAELQAKLTAFKAKEPKAKQMILQRAIDDLAASSMLQGALTIDATAPDFTLPDATGKKVNLSDLLDKGPVVLIWYRGGWCPYCNIALRRYVKMVPELKKLGATLVVLSPDTPKKAKTTKKKLQLPMIVLSDVGLKVARSYGIVFRLPPDVKAVYDKSFKLKAWNGTDKGDLPFPATFVLDRNGRIRYAFADADYRRRAEPSEILSAVRLRAAPVKNSLPPAAIAPEAAPAKPAAAPSPDPADPSAQPLKK